MPTEPSRKIIRRAVPKQVDRVGLSGVKTGVAKLVIVGVLAKRRGHAQFRDHQGNKMDARTGGVGVYSSARRGRTRPLEFRRNTVVL